ncbi:MCE family protein [Mycolicibacterium pyrenivorans]|uniref:MCE family protein n=1 Tax=Mycolicibacterium pyrenivorans TaxID=187102 RepID=UPI0021F2CA6D|nr:MCE family protein [Mycolicibacterium pyrenivorans]MCV7152894.1 MCE family protein [Mycolicibacterium pyrenivorans]
MIKYRGTHLIRSGFIGVVLILLIIAVGLQPERIIGWMSAIKYAAVFTEAGGLAVGNDVKVSGVSVGSVTDVSLSGPHALVTFTVTSGVSLGSQTTAHIRTGTLLGARVLTLESAGSGTLEPLAVIPTSRTGSPYSLTEAVSELTTNSAATDTAALNTSLDTLATTLDQIAPQLGPTFDGLSRLSTSLNSRNETIGELLRHAGDVTDVLATQSQQVNELILNSNDLLAVLVERRQMIVRLLNGTSALSRQLSGLIADNEQELAPTLEQLNSVTEMLERSRDNIAKAVPLYAKYQSTLSESVATGPYYVAHVPNLSMPMFMQPFFDYAFGFRRGVDAGQPPDSTGPRAEIPFPRNGIPIIQQGG